MDTGARPRVRGCDPGDFLVERANSARARWNAARTLRRAPRLARSSQTLLIRAPLRPESRIDSRFLATALRSGTRGSSHSFDEGRLGRLAGIYAEDRSSSDRRDSSVPVPELREQQQRPRSDRSEPIKRSRLSRAGARSRTLRSREPSPSRSCAARILRAPLWHDPESVGRRGDDRRVSGKQIKLFLVDGTPGGLTTAEITNWTGHVLSARRSDLADLLKRDEAQRTGSTCCWVTTKPPSATPAATSARPTSWPTGCATTSVTRTSGIGVVVITSKDTNLTKSHGRYLESRLISLATQAGRVTLENGTARPSRRCPRRMPRTWTTSWPNSRSFCRCSASMRFGCVRPSRRRRHRAGEHRVTGLPARAGQARRRRPGTADRRRVHDAGRLDRGRRRGMASARPTAP